MALVLATQAITEAGSGVSSINATEPASAALGDFLVAFHGIDGGETEGAGPPALWALNLDGLASRACDLQVSSILRGSSAPDLGFDHSSPEEGQVMIARFTGQSSSPIGAMGKNDGNSTSPTCPSIDTLSDNSIVLFGYCANTAVIGAEDVGFPAGTTGLFNRDTSENTGAVTGGLAHQAYPTGGTATGTKVWTITGAAAWFAFTLEILEMGGGAVTSAKAAALL